MQALTLPSHEMQIFRLQRLTAGISLSCSGTFQAPPAMAPEAPEEEHDEEGVAIYNFLVQRLFEFLLQL